MQERRFKHNVAGLNMIRVKTQNALTLVIRYRSSLFISLGWEGVREGARGDLGGF